MIKSKLIISSYKINNVFKKYGLKNKGISLLKKRAKKKGVEEQIAMVADLYYSGFLMPSKILFKRLVDRFLYMEIGSEEIGQIKIKIWKE